ncbi:hypothetical protein M433DRAFT_451990 [Acidomyces richmondensis BFW]|nr:hypothetical protein M433DRAFT_451990 [Acidomyces richmondensis BFW]
MASKQHVVVIGAGVIGLTSATFLAKAGYLVSIIAAHMPGDASIEYTSPWAGAHWRTHASSNDQMLCDWDLQTYNEWQKLLEMESKNLKMPRSGLKIYESLHYWDGDVEEDLWWAPYVKEFRQLSTSQEPCLSIAKLSPPGEPVIQNAASSQSIAVNVPHYLKYLQDKARSQGVRFIKARLPEKVGLSKALREAENLILADGGCRPNAYVNATGLGAAKLTGDEALYPIRGQTVLVKGEAVAIRTRIGDGYVAYCIPRPGSGTTILGGVKEVGNWSGGIDPETTRKIQDRCSYIVPELLTGKDGGFEIISVQCGLRPGRKGGPRIEKEVVDEKKVIHAYGHAGAGYQNSIGCARAVVKLVGEILAFPSLYASI